MTLLKLAAGAENDFVPPPPTATPNPLPTASSQPADASALPDLELPPAVNGWALYRDRTVAMLRKYFRMSLHLGRIPSLLGREIFRGRVTTYEARNFEDVVIFVHDMETCLARLDPLSRLMLARVVLQEFTHDDVAAQCRISRRQVIRRLELALDEASELLVDANLMQALHNESLPPKKRPTRADCDSGWNC